MSNFLNALKHETNYTYTENGAVTHKTTESDLYDLFAMGGAYRSRSKEDCILLFKRAYAENPLYALKCLFYLRDRDEGQGERRFFRTCIEWLALTDPDAVRRNLSYIPTFGRWDDLYTFVGTSCEKDAFDFMKEQFALDLKCKTPSLLAKWLKSENTSSKESRRLGTLTRQYFHMTPRQYRKTLSYLRERINVLERLMSANKWDEIEFDKIPSRAGLIYRNAFARHDVERAKSERNVQTYADFAKDETKTVNAKVLYPYECTAEAFRITRPCLTGWNSRNGDISNIDPTQRAIINKYWDNLKDVFNGYSFNGLCVIDTSASMWDTKASAPINVATSLGLYCAEKASGPFYGHYISFSRTPQLINVEGVDFVDKVFRIYKTNICENTDIEATFDMLLHTAVSCNIDQEDLPENIIVVSDMEFDYQCGIYGNNRSTLMENIRTKWENWGYKMPHLVFWNVDARQNNIPMRDEDGITFVSGFSPNTFEMIMTGKTAQDLMYDKLNSERYECIK